MSRHGKNLFRNTALKSNEMPVAAAAAVLVRRNLTQKRKKLEQRKKDRHLRDEENAQKWFDKFDVNGSGDLDRDELTKLLTALDPSFVFSDDALEYLRGEVTRKNVLSVVKKLRAYMKQKHRLDSLVPVSRTHRVVKYLFFLNNEEKKITKSENQKKNFKNFLSLETMLISFERTTRPSDPNSWPFPFRF